MLLTTSRHVCEYYSRRRC